MTIGNGLIANGLKLSSKHQTIVLFASGVSNSNETNPAAFDREKKLLIQSLEQHNDKTFVYISSCDVEDPLDNTMYYSHKLAMEDIVKRSTKKHYIFRLPQVVGKTTNKNTLFSFLVDKTTHNQPFDVWTKATRNLIDVDDVDRIINYILSHNIFRNEITNIASLHNTSILELVTRIETYMGKKARYDEVPKGHEYKIDTTKIEKILVKLNITFDASYLERLIQKYIYIQNEV